MVRSNKTFKGSITEGREYQVVSKRHNMFVIIDDEGYQIGWSQDYFTLPQPVLGMTAAKAEKIMNTYDELKRSKNGIHQLPPPKV